MIDVNNLSKEFIIRKNKPGLSGAIKGIFSNNKEIKCAVKNLNFHVNKGDILGYIGNNGAGKSTTIKMMCGILTPTSGCCHINGIIPYKNRKLNASNIGVVFGQRTQLWWDLPLTETFSILKKIYKVNDNDFKKRINFLNEVLDLSNFSSNQVRTLSLGQRMRADLAAALIHNPKVLFLDEPTIGLDIIVKDKIRTAIKEINSRYQTTIVLTTHDMHDIQSLCNRVIILNDGKKIYDNSIQNLKTIYGNLKTIKLTFDIPQDIVLIRSLFSYPAIKNIWSEDTSIFITFDNTKIDAPTILTEFISKLHPTEISINETNVEDIVKKIYTSKSVY